MPAASPDVRRARAKEFLVQAVALATVLWAAVLYDSCSLSTTGRLTRSLKGADFAQFYTLGAAVATGDHEALVARPAFTEALRRHVPPPGIVGFPPIYGPQVAVAFSPLARLPYLWAYALWALATVLIAVASVLWLVGVAGSLREYRTQAVAATFAYPVLSLTVLSGQVSAVALGALALTAGALTRGSRAWAGVCLGVLGYKMSLFLPAVAVCLLAGEWVVVAVASAVAVAQLAIGIPIVGLSSVLGFVENLWFFARHPDLIAKPFAMASLRTFWTMLLPAPAANAVYALTAMAAIALTARAWRRASIALDRVGILALGIALATPHLYVYDLLIVIPAFACSAEHLLDPGAGRSSGLKIALCGAFLAPLLTLGGLTYRLPLVTPALVALWIALQVTVCRAPLATTHEEPVRR